MEPRTGGVGSGEVDAGAQLKRIVAAARSSVGKLFVYSVVGLILGTFVASILPELYESRTLVLLRERQLVEDSAILRAIEDKPLQVKEQTLEEEFKSYGFIDRVLERAGWKEYQDIKHRMAKPEEFVKGDSVAAARAIEKIRKQAQDDQQKLIEKVRKDKYFNVGVNTSAAGELLVNLTMKWFEPKLARDFVFEARKYWVSKRDDEYKRYYRKQLEDAEKTLEARKKEYELATQNLEDFSRQNNVSFLNNEDNPDAKVQVELATQLSQTQSQIAELEVRVRALEERKERTPPTLEQSTKEPNPEYVMVKQSYDLAAGELAKLSEHYQDNHPVVQKQRQLVEKAKAALEAMKGKEYSETQTQSEQNPEYTAITQSLAVDAPQLQALRERAVSIEKQKAEVVKRLEQQPMIQSMMKRLNNAFEVAQTSLNEAMIAIKPLQEKVAKWEGQSAGIFADPESDLKNTGAYEVLEDPYEAGDPTGIPRAAISVIGLLVGLAFGLASLLLTEMMRSTFDEAGEAQNALGIPVLATIGRISTILEERRARWRGIARAFGVLMIVGALGTIVTVMVAAPEKLPPLMQEYLKNLKTALQ